MLIFDFQSLLAVATSCQNSNSEIDFEGKRRQILLQRLQINCLCSYVKQEADEVVRINFLLQIKTSGPISNVTKAAQAT